MDVLLQTKPHRHTEDGTVLMSVNYLLITPLCRSAVSFAYLVMSKKWAHSVPSCHPLVLSLGRWWAGDAISVCEFGSSRQPRRFNTEHFVFGFSCTPRLFLPPVCRG